MDLCDDEDEEQSSPLRQFRNQSFNDSVFHDVHFGSWRHTISRMESFITDMEDMSHTSSRSSSSSSSTRLPSEDENDSSSVEEVALQGSWSCCSVRRGCPSFYEWLMSRYSTNRKAIMIILFMALDATKFEMQEQAYFLAMGDVNLVSVLVMSNLVSLCTALLISFILEGRWAVKKIFSWHHLWRFLGIAALFTIASFLIACAYRGGTSAATVSTVGYMYLPISAVLSCCIFSLWGRRYGLLEWLSLGMISLATLTFILLRERGKRGTLPNEEGFFAPGIVIVISAVFVSALASILSERIYKGRSLGLIRRKGPGNLDRFHIMKVHLDFSALVFTSMLWIVPASFSSFLMPSPYTNTRWFGSWSLMQVFLVAINVMQGWLAGLVTKHFNTVVRCMAQTLSTVLVVCVFDPMQNKFDFHSRDVPTVMLAVIVMMSAMVFQTGRQNIQSVKQQLRFTEKMPEMLADYDLGWRSALVTIFCPTFGNQQQNAEPEAPSPQAEEDDEYEVEDNHSSVRKRLGSDARGIVTKYASMLLYVLADASKTLVLAAALSRSTITPQSMPLMVFVCGVLVASFMTVCTDDCDGLKQAWRPDKILRSLPCGCFFAMASSMTSMAYAIGITASMNAIIGKVYVPFAAVASRWILHKFYMWLEWFALLITTLAAATFGYLKSIDPVDGNPVGIGAILLVIGSALSAVLGSLTTEKILKGEKAAFHIQKVRLDIGSIFTSVILLPVMGFISYRPQDGFWRDRPLSAQCPDAACWGAVGSNFTCANPACGCECGHGFFVGWNNWLIVAALAASLFHGWLSGKVAKKFSTVDRALADCSSLLLIYFVGDPLIAGASIKDWTLNFVAFIVPLSSATFMVASSEMKTAMTSAMGEEISSGTTDDQGGSADESESS